MPPPTLQTTAEGAAASPTTPAQRPAATAGSAAERVAAGARPAAGPRPVTAEGTLWASTGLSVALLLAFAVAGALDARTLGGDNVWLKPAKFALSFAVLFATMAWVVERLSPAVRQGRALRFTLAAMVLAFWTEMAYIGGRAGLGLASHFAVGTPLEAAMYALMGVGAVTLVLGIGTVGWLAARDHGAAMGLATRTGVALGFMLTTALTLVTAGVLSSNGGHFVGTPSADAVSLPLLGWSGEVGDLRPAHFLALHAMQALPLLGAGLDRRSAPSGAAGRTALGAAAAAYALATAAVFVQALMGWPLVRL
jgi:hypothetical protein